MHCKSQLYCKSQWRQPSDNILWFVFLPFHWAQLLGVCILYHHRMSIPTIMSIITNMFCCVYFITVYRSTSLIIYQAPVTLATLSDARFCTRDENKLPRKAVTINFDYQNQDILHTHQMGTKVLVKFSFLNKFNIILKAAAPKCLYFILAVLQTDSEFSCQTGQVRFRISLLRLKFTCLQKCMCLAMFKC